MGHNISVCVCGFVCVALCQSELHAVQCSPKDDASNMKNVITAHQNRITVYLINHLCLTNQD